VKLRYLGLAVGALIGFLWMWLGFGEMLVVVLCAIVGWLIAGVIEGEIDVRKFLDGFKRK
jgi:hypothetical protein